jgi:GntR family transcriptional regulator
VTVEEFLERRLLSTAGQPLRVAVYTRLADGIRSDVFPPGTPLPRETELAVALGVSRTVVREALMLLEEDGLVVTRRGVGRFVAQSLPRVGLEELRPFEIALSEPGSPLSVRPLRFNLQQTTDYISSGLALDAAANTWFREAVLLRDDLPVAIVQEHLPAGRYLSDVHPGIADCVEDLATANSTLLAGILDRFGPILNAGVCKLAASIAGQTRASLLGVGSSQAVLVLTQTAEHDGTPLYLAKCIVSPAVGNLSIVQSSAN